MTMSDAPVATEPFTDESGAAAETASRRRRARRDDLGAGRLPPAATLLARPALLAMGAVFGLLLGAGLAGNQGFVAEAQVHFTNAGTDSLRVKQIGQTVAEQATSEPVLDLARKSRNATAADLGTRTTATWTADTELVEVKVRARTMDDAVADANAVADAMVTDSEATITEQLVNARKELNSLLKNQQLDAVDAESARRSQLGSALAGRQDSISSQAGDLVVADPATIAGPVGLTRPMGAAVGLVGGLLLAGLAALLLGARSLRAFSPRTLRAFVGADLVYGPSQAPQLAGEFAESDRAYLAIVSMDGADEEASTLADEIAYFIRAQGSTVRVVETSEFTTREQSARYTNRAARERVHSISGTDRLVVVVGWDSEGCAMLQGQSDLAAIIVMRRRLSPVLNALRMLRNLGPARPVIVLAR